MREEGNKWKKSWAKLSQKQRILREGGNDEIGWLKELSNHNSRSFNDGDKSMFWSKLSPSDNLTRWGGRDGSGWLKFPTNTMWTTEDGKGGIGELKREKNLREVTLGGKWRGWDKFYLSVSSLISEAKRRYFDQNSLQV